MEGNTDRKKRIEVSGVGPYRGPMSKTAAPCNIRPERTQSTNNNTHNTKCTKYTCNFTKQVFLFTTTSFKRTRLKQRTGYNEHLSYSNCILFCVKRMRIKKTLEKFNIFFRSVRYKQS